MSELVSAVTLTVTSYFSQSFEISTASLVNPPDGRETRKKLRPAMDFAKKQTFNSLPPGIVWVKRHEAPVFRFQN